MILLLLLLVITNVSVIAFLEHGSLAAMATMVEGKGIAEFAHLNLMWKAIVELLRVISHQMGRAIFTVMHMIRSSANEHGRSKS
jgi:hypothetical protein